MDPKTLIENEYDFKAVLETMPFPVYITNNDLRILFSNLNGHLLMKQPSEFRMKNRCGDLLRCVHAHEEQDGCGSSSYCKKCAIRNAVIKAYKENKTIMSKTHQLVTCNGSTQSLFLLINAIPYHFDKQKLVLLTLEDISRIIKPINADQIIKGKNQEQFIAQSDLELLMARYNDIKQRVQEDFTVNITKKLLPIIEKISRTNSDDMQKIYLAMLIDNIQQFASPFYRKLSGKYYGLTHTEIKVADFIKKGKTTKEIAELTGLSIRAIEFHRHNIRKKLGLLNKKSSLKSFFNSLD